LERKGIVIQNLVHTHHYSLTDQLSLVTIF